MLPKRLALLRLNLRRLLSTWVVLMPVRGMLQLISNSVFFVECWTYMFVNARMYTRFQAFFHGAWRESQSVAGFAVTFRWARKETTKSLRWVRCHHARLSFMAGHCRLHKTCRVFFAPFPSMWFGVYFILEVQMNYTRGFFQISCGLKCLSRWHPCSMLTGICDSSGIAGGDNSLELVLWLICKYGVDHSSPNISENVSWFPRCGDLFRAHEDSQICGWSAFCHVQGLAAKQELSKIRCYGLKWIGVVSKM